MSITIEQFIERMNQVLPSFIRKVHARQTNVFAKGALSLLQLFVLDLLRNKKDIKMTEIAKELNISGPAVTGIIDKLEKADYVKRVPSVSDRRVIFIKLTKKGFSLDDKIKTERTKVMAEGFGKLSPDEREIYVSILEKVNKILGGEEQ